MNMPYLASRIPIACRRRLARWLGRRSFVVEPERAIVSFTFDDFPRSALVNGGRILARHDAAGTYYACLGLAGRTGATGEMFTLDDLDSLFEAGHELGCHTYSHCPAWETQSEVYEAALLRNAAALRQHAPGGVFSTHSYPISYPRPETKRIASRYFDCCRAGGQTLNLGSVDLNHLNAYFIEQSRDHVDAIKAMIDANARERGWLIFATHDVTDHPTRFGCTPALFEHIVGYAAASGAQILPVRPALGVANAAVPAPSIPA